MNFKQFNLVRIQVTIKPWPEGDTSIRSALIKLELIKEELLVISGLHDQHDGFWGHGCWRFTQLLEGLMLIVLLHKLGPIVPTCIG